MSPRTFSLPANLQSALASLLEEEGVLLTDSAKIAAQVNRLSDYYIAHPSGATPWEETFTRVAYIAYYLPLNFLRAQAVFQEAQAQHFPALSKDIEALVDFGSGLGSGSLPWMLACPERKYYFVERSTKACELHRKLLSFLKINTATAQWSAELPSLLTKNDYANHVASVFSYSLTELQTLPPWVMECRDLILIEPSTREDGRKLLQMREQLRSKNFSFWAPCVHQLTCPLWLHSKNDWCHDRIHLSPPEWLVSVENHLPFKNRTLTFSYLLASQKAAAKRTQARLVGDQLHEKGKSKQLVCHTDQREFLTWLHRDGEVPELYRGDLIDLPEGILPSKNPQSGELRMPKRN